MVMQMNTRRPVNGTQLFMTAVMEITISRRYITVRFSAGVKGDTRLTAAIIPAAVTPKGSALASAVFRKLPRIRRVSDSRIVTKDGHASMQASIRVIWIGINGNGTLAKMQKKDTSTE